MHLNSQFVFECLYLFFMCLPDREKGIDVQRMAMQKEIICDGSAMVLKQKGRGMSDGICGTCQVPRSGTTKFSTTVIASVVFFQNFLLFLFFIS